MTGFGVQAGTRMWGIRLRMVGPGLRDLMETVLDSSQEWLWAGIAALPRRPASCALAGTGHTGGIRKEMGCLKSK